MKLAWLLMLSQFVPLWAGQGTPSGDVPHILPMRQRAEVMDRWLEKRLETVVPTLMRREGIDMWILIAREYNEDPVVKTMLPATWLSARRRTILVFHDTGAEVARLAVARYDIGKSFASVWNKEEQPDQWARLREIIEARDPKKIAINVSKDFALADGITHHEHEAFRQALPDTYRERLVPGENLAIGWLETRIADEMAVYPQIVAIAHHLIAEAFSNKAIQPGITTTADVQWYLRERVRELKLVVWFHPSVSIQRRDQPEHAGNFSSKPAADVIQRGDLLHVDFGITYLGLNTDTQQHAYVLRTGETDAPQELKDALATGNRLQDILTDQFIAERSGNTILAGALKQAKSEDINATIYTHPIGFHGHGAGPTIGLWDQQGGVPGKGDYPLYNATAYSIELNAAVHLSVWDKEIRIMLEEDGFFEGPGFYYINGRQTQLHLIR